MCGILETDYAEKHFNCAQNSEGLCNLLMHKISHSSASQCSC